MRAIYVSELDIMLFLFIFLIVNSLGISAGCCVSIGFLLKLCLACSETFELSSRCANASCLCFATYCCGPIVLALKIVCRMVPLNTFNVIKSLVNDPIVLLVEYSKCMLLELKFCIALCLSVRGYLLNNLFFYSVALSFSYLFLITYVRSFVCFKYKLNYCVVREIILNICLFFVRSRFGRLILDIFSLNIRVML